MFTGIVEGLGQTRSQTEKDQVLSIEITRPGHFDDLKPGDSICCNGVCLTVVSYDSEVILFDLGPETLQITGWGSSRLPQVWNMERSLRYGDRIHGHLVTGHVDSMAKIEKLTEKGDSLEIRLRVPEKAMKFVVAKGSLCIQGVSLTLNQVTSDTVEVCLIPETLKRTSLGQLSEGDFVTIETDYFLKGLLCTTRSN